MGIVSSPADVRRKQGAKTMTNQTSKVAIVTGASGGIGAAVAERLARDGFAVVINYAGNAASAEALVRKIEATGGRAFSAQADVSDAAQVARMFDAAEAAFGGVDILVNNAGIMNLATIADSDDVLFDRQIAINLKGTFNTLREAARRLRDGGRIVNVSSSVVGMLQPTYGVYAATKAAVEALTSILAKELRGRNITVNAIAPGPTATKLFLDGKPQEVIDRLSKLAPLERLGQPEDIAAAVAFLAGPDGAWINGQTLRANGGII
jgi:3-oxoacyl-[acyl-carrier protein] reductase